MKKFNVTIKGISPLLQARHPNPAEEEKIRLISGKDKKKKVSEKEQFDIHAYRNDKGKFVQPAEMIEASMVKAATSFRMEGKKTYKDAFKAGLFIDPVEILHKNQKFVPDGRWAQNVSIRGAVWVVRPRVDEWELNFTVNLLLDERIPGELVKEVLQYAGMYIGIGAWRPKFGRFEIVKFEEVA
jgi:hypothetical protein